MFFELNEPTASDVAKKSLKLVSTLFFEIRTIHDPDMLDMLVDMFQCRNLKDVVHGTLVCPHGKHLLQTGKAFTET